MHICKQAFALDPGQRTEPARRRHRTAGVRGIQRLVLIIKDVVVGFASSALNKLLRQCCIEVPAGTAAIRRTELARREQLNAGSIAFIDGCRRGGC
ncbi:hypothetical protein D3C72_2213460 [compost metagenome]